MCDGSLHAPATRDKRFREDTFCWCGVRPRGLEARAELLPRANRDSFWLGLRRSEPANRRSAFQEMAWPGGCHRDRRRQRLEMTEIQSCELPGDTLLSRQTCNYKLPTFEEDGKCAKETEGSRSPGQDLCADSDGQAGVVR